MVVRATGSDKEMTFDVGEPGVGGGPGGGGSISFSDDSKWVGFMTYPKRADAQRLRRQRRPVQNGVTIVNLASGEKHEYQKGRRFAFSGESSAWIALARYAPPASGGRGGAPAGRPGRWAGRPGREESGSSDRPRGADLILRDLASGQELNVGNVSDFSFSRDGKLLALTIGAQDKAGNGVHLRDMSTGATRVLDSGSASYERLTWTEKYDAIAVLKGTDDRRLRDKRYAVLGFTNLTAAAPMKTLYDPASDQGVPRGHDRQRQATAAPSGPRICRPSSSGFTSHVRAKAMRRRGTRRRTRPTTRRKNRNAPARWSRRRRGATATTWRSRITSLPTASGRRRRGSRASIQGSPERRCRHGPMPHSAA